jgi:hypothetical protein
VQISLLFLFFHKRLCGPLAISRFHHDPMPNTTETVALRRRIIALTRPFSP